MRILAVHLGGIAGVVYQNFLRGDEDVNCVPIGFHVKRPVGRELQQVHAGQVAGGVVEEHVLAAWVRRVDAVGVFRSVPAVDGGVVLHAGIAAVPGGFGNLAKKFFGLEGVHGAAIANGASGEIGVTHDGVHEIVGDADGVVGILEEDGRIGVGVGMRSVVAFAHEGVGLGFFFLLALDEV